MAQHLWNRIGSMGRICEECLFVQSTGDDQQWRPAVSPICPGDDDNSRRRRAPPNPPLPESLVELQRMYRAFVWGRR